MFRALKLTAKFLVTLLSTTIAFSMIWSGLVADKLYNCTDAVGFDYFQPGDWVHRPVVVVDHVVEGRSMSEPDAIKKGWSVMGLWVLWISFVAVSLAGSFVMARMTWMPASNAEAGGCTERRDALVSDQTSSARRR